MKNKIIDLKDYLVLKEGKNSFTIVKKTGPTFSKLHLLENWLEKRKIILRRAQ